MAMTLVFKVPVHVEVDEVARAVLSVKVDDERAEGPVEVVAGAEGEDLAELLARGAAVADEASWPVWEFGL
ncbi:MAG: hypothetical protein IPG97_09165 [Microthrixaceae bacterium]|jgi:hypothetical protein|nr:hypothetical protein [Microthrixaceae bacterium]